MAGGKSVLSTLVVKLIGDIKGFEDSTTKAQAAAKKMNSQIADGFQSLTGISLSAAGGIAAVAGALKYSFDQAIEAERVMAATQATLDATGRAAEITAEEIERLAGRQSRLTGIDDETVQSGMNVLLTYKQIGESVLPRASQAMADMAAFQAKGNLANIDLSSSATQLGKALAAPERAASLLYRQGIVLNDQQRRQISAFLEMNNIAGAQGVILDALGSKYGGMAEAMGDTTSGKLQKLRVNIDNLAQSIGEWLTPILGSAAEAANTLFFGADQLADSFYEHNQVMIQSAGTYEEYAAEMERARGVAGTAADNVKTLSEAEWEAARAAAAAEAATGPMGAAMAGAATPAGALATYIGDQAAALDIVMGSMKEVTQEMLFQKAAQGLDADAALELGRAMGMIDETSYTILFSLEQTRQKYDENADGLIDATEAAAGYIAQIEALSKRLDILNGKVANVEVRYTEHYSSAGGLYRPTEMTAIAQAEGGDWIVNEPTLFLAGEAGAERATFTPVGQEKKDQPMIVQFYVNTQLDLNDTLAELERIKRRNR